MGGGAVIASSWPSALTTLLLPNCLTNSHFFPLCAVNCSEDEERLVRDLFRDYNKLIRPVKHINDTVFVEVKLSFIQLINIVSIITFVHYYWLLLLNCPQWVELGLNCYFVTHLPLPPLHNYFLLSFVNWQTTRLIKWKRTAKFVCKTSPEAIWNISQL